MPSQLLNLLERQQPEPTVLHEPHANTPPAEYDLNFEYPVFDELRSSGVILRPFIPSLYGREDYELFQSKEASVVWAYLPYGPFESWDQYLNHLERNRADPGTLYCAVWNTADVPEGEFVGAIALLNTSRAHCVTEIGHIRFHPKAQRTHVNTQAVALLLEHCFEVYKCRRVAWFANALNLPSQNAAVRLGFKREAIIRWQRVLPHLKAQHSPEMIVPADSEYGSPEAGVGRHSALLAICWDEWVDGTKESVQKLRDREPVRRLRSTADYNRQFLAQ